MAVEEQIVVEDKVKLEEDDEDFRSCCEDEDELRAREESSEVDSEDCLDEHSLKMYFKGVSVACPGESGSRISGIGVVMEVSGNQSPIQIQKRLDFFVEESIADYLALLDGLSVAIQRNIRRVFAFTDSEGLYNQIICDEVVDAPLLVALRQRILEQSNNIETFVLKCVPAIDVLKALHLAQVAVGIVSFPVEGEEATERCSICCEEKLSAMMLTIKCSHRFCSHCLKSHVEGKVESAQVPIRCPRLGCKYCISASECMSFLPVTSYDSLEKVIAETNILNSNKIYCPYSCCYALLDSRECLSTRVSSSSQSDNSRVECPVCQRIICVDCGVPWHSSMTCEEYQNLPREERDSPYPTLHHLTHNRRWRCCQRCQRMIEIAHGTYHVECWCGYDFCYSCDAEYRDGQQTCRCVSWNEEYADASPINPTQQFEQWAWDSFESFPMTMDAYSEQEKSQLALIQRFLAGGFGLMDHSYNQSPPHCTDSYADAMKDLDQLPWLERFVSVISDNYYEDYIQ